MKLTHKQLKQIEEFAKEKMKNNDASHQTHHILRTVHISKVLAEKEKADILKCTVIAWLHDIEKSKSEEGLDHGEEGAKSAIEFLEKIGLEKEDIQGIAYAIRRHNKGDPHNTIESKIIWDADKLQAMGMEGILRLYRHWLNEGQEWENAYKTTIKEQKFYFERFRTKTGRKFAKERFDFFKKALKEYELEFNVKR